MESRYKIYSNRSDVQRGNPARNMPSWLLFSKRPHRGLLAILGMMLLVFSANSCKKFVEVNPPVTSVTDASVFSSDVTAAAVLTGMYTNISATSSSSSGFDSMSVYGGLSADELTLISGGATQSFTTFYTNALLSSLGSGFIPWGFYPYIFKCNSAIEGLNASGALTPAVKQQLLGEAKFMRALFYFYLVNLYGDVPMPLSSDYTVNAVLARTSKALVYQQIVSDLKDAQNLLSPNYLDATLLAKTVERVRPTSWAATALLARVYLYTGDWQDASVQATAVINNSGVFSLSTLNNAFLKASAGNNEAIWQLQPVNLGWNTEDARIFIIPSTGPNANNPVFLSNNLLNSFEPGDQRKLNWIKSVTAGSTTYYYPYKYKSATLNAPVTEYEMVLRLGEQYLIRAEAEANGAGGGVNAAVRDLNVIRTRAGLPNYAGATDQASLLTAILHERQVELFTEWGHRWLDLKRTGNADAVMSVVCPQKGGTWSTNWQLYPLPLGDIQKDQNLVQNPGY